jgi:opacity protein-like surface antigen
MNFHQMRSVAATALLLGIFLATPAAAQTITVRVTASTVVLVTPRGVAYVLVPIPLGTTLQILDQRPGWYQVRATKLGSMPWDRGWIQARFVELVDGGAAAEAESKATTGIRGFVQGGGSLFNARNSFETILGSAFGPMFGGGVQYGFANGTFVQASVGRFRKSGSRAIVSGSQVFRLQSPDEITVTPIQFSVGYRDFRATRVVPYVGGGIGWHMLKEESATLQGSDDVNGEHIGYHILGGIEYPIGSWMSLGGEVQWSAVPGVLGQSGVSAAFDEKDLGEATFRFKVNFGR